MFFPDLKCCQYLTVPARSANYSRKHQYFEFPGNVCSGLYPFRKRSSKGKDQEKKTKSWEGQGGGVDIINEDGKKFLSI